MSPRSPNQQVSHTGSLQGFIQCRTWAALAFSSPTFCYTADDSPFPSLFPCFFPPQCPEYEHFILPPQALCSDQCPALAFTTVLIPFAWLPHHPNKPQLQTMKRHSQLEQLIDVTLSQPHLIRTLPFVMLCIPAHGRVVGLDDL